MKLTGDPASPPVRFAQMLLLDATREDVSELRLWCGQESMGIGRDGKDQPGPKADVYRPTADAILKFAGLRVWPWTKRIAGKRLDVEFDTLGLSSSWTLASSDIGSELILTRIRGENEDMQADG